LRFQATELWIIHNFIEFLDRELFVSKCYYSKSSSSVFMNLVCLKRLLIFPLNNLSLLI
jgi:hypothetical protein